MRSILIFLFFFLTNIAYSQSTSSDLKKCYDPSYYDVSWFISNGLVGSESIAKFTIKSKTEKSIIIKTISIKTVDKKVMRSKEYNTTLKPFEVLQLDLSLKNLNTDLIKFASATCEFGIGKNNNAETTGAIDFFKKIIGQ